MKQIEYTDEVDQIRLRGPYAVCNCCRRSGQQLARFNPMSGLQIELCADCLKDGLEVIQTATNKVVQRDVVTP